MLIQSCLVYIWSFIFFAFVLKNVVLLPSMFQPFSEMKSPQMSVAALKRAPKSAPVHLLPTPVTYKSEKGLNAEGKLFSKDERYD